MSLRSCRSIAAARGVSPDKKTCRYPCVWIMPAQNNAIKLILFGLLSCLAPELTSPRLTAQTPQKPVQDQSDVVRVFTNLVQTDVMVFDKQGKVVNGLQREAFQLKIDGR